MHYGVIAFLILIPSLARSANYSVNVYTSSSSLQSDFIASTTTQFNASVIPSTFFPNTYTINLYGKNLMQGVTDYGSILSNTISRLVKISSDTYLYGWADGREYTIRGDSQMVLDLTVKCSNAVFFNITDVPIDAQTCREVLGFTSNFIYDQINSTPTVIPGF